MSNKGRKRYRLDFFEGLSKRTTRLRVNLYRLEHPQALSMLAMANGTERSTRASHMSIFRCTRRSKSRGYSCCIFVTVFMLSRVPPCEVTELAQVTGQSGTCQQDQYDERTEGAITNSKSSVILTSDVLFSTTWSGTMASLARIASAAPEADRCSASSSRRAG